MDTSDWHLKFTKIRKGAINHLLAIIKKTQKIRNFSKSSYSHTSHSFNSLKASFTMDSFSFSDFQPIMNNTFEATTFDYNQEQLLNSIYSPEQDSNLIEFDIDTFNDYYSTSSPSSSSTYSQSLSSPIEAPEISILEPQASNYSSNILTDAKNFSNVMNLDINTSIAPSIESTILSPYIEPSLLFNRPFPNNLSTSYQPNSNSLLFNNFPQDLIGSAEEISRITSFNEEKERLKKERNNSFTNAGLLFKPLNSTKFDSYATDTSSNSGNIPFPSIKSNEVKELERMVSHVGVGRGNGRRRSSVASSTSSSSSSKKEEKLKSTTGRPRGKGKFSKTDSTTVPVITTSARNSSISKSPTTKSKKLSLSKSSPSTRISNRILSRQSLDFSPPPPSYTYATSDSNLSSHSTPVQFDTKALPLLPPPTFSSILARLQAAEKKSLLNPSPIQTQFQINQTNNKNSLGLEGLEIEIVPLKSQFSREWEEIKKSRINEGWKAFGVENGRVVVGGSDVLVI